MLQGDQVSRVNDYLRKKAYLLRFQFSQVGIMLVYSFANVEKGKSERRWYSSKMTVMGSLEFIQIVDQNDISSLNLINNDTVSLQSFFTIVLMLICLLPDQFNLSEIQEESLSKGQCNKGELDPTFGSETPLVESQMSNIIPMRPRVSITMKSVRDEGKANNQLRGLSSRLGNGNRSVEEFHDEIKEVYI